MVVEDETKLKSSNWIESVDQKMNNKQSFRSKNEDQQSKIRHTLKSTESSHDDETSKPKYSVKTNLESEASKRKASVRTKTADHETQANLLQETEKRNRGMSSESKQTQKLKASERSYSSKVSRDGIGEGWKQI